jgi:hypothetical protein
MKIEELEAISRRNEECINLIKNSVVGNRRYEGSYSKGLRYFID